MSLEVAFPNLFFERMVYLTHTGNKDTDRRLFLVLQRGKILVFPNRKDVNSTKTFLNITGRVDSTGNEQGLLGLAFDPDFQKNRQFYVYYTAASPSRSIISRFTQSSMNPDQADPNSETAILEIAQQYPNHNGGQIMFGSDSYLYIGLGDGGEEGDPQRNGQNVGTLLGKILRIYVHNTTDSDKNYRVPPDNPFVNVTGARGEIWAYGLRNPWRFSFDNETNLLWAADVGQNNYEEIDIIKKGGNYGWSIMEGFHCYPLIVLNCDKKG
jgi:glucose/arabinose dehydrogenase